MKQQQQKARFSTGDAHRNLQEDVLKWSPPTNVALRGTHCTLLPRGTCMSRRGRHRDGHPVPTQSGSGPLQPHSYFSTPSWVRSQRKLPRPLHMMSRKSRQNPLPMYGRKTAHWVRKKTGPEKLREVAPCACIIPANQQSLFN